MSCKSIEITEKLNQLCQRHFDILQRFPGPRIKRADNMLYVKVVF